VRENAKQVDGLVAELREAGILVWLDRDNIQPGRNWKSSIRRAIHDGAFFLACFSQESLRRQRTYMNDELRLRPNDHGWFIPVLLDDSEVPDRSIGAGQTLADLHAVNLSSDWDSGIRHLIATIRGLPATIDTHKLDAWLNSKFAIAVQAADSGSPMEQDVSPVMEALKALGYVRMFQICSPEPRLLTKRAPDAVATIYVIHDGNTWLADRLASTLRKLNVAPRVLVLTTIDAALVSDGIEASRILWDAEVLVLLRRGLTVVSHEVVPIQATDG
jgi:hypothetical protein